MPILTIKGRELTIDEIDLPLVRAHSWHWTPQGYLVTKIPTGKCQRKTVLFHRLALNPPVGKVVDHVNRDKSDNRRMNLRICTRSQNSMNRGLLAKNGKGVSFHKTRKKWQVVVRHEDRVHWLGYFTTKAEAIVVSEKFFSEAGHNPFRH